MRMLVTGAGGQLGAAFLRRLRADAVGQTRTDLDVTDGARVRAALRRFHPDVVVNCAAYTDVDGAEREPDRAMAVNADAVRNVAAACAEVQAVLVHFSTDYVFDGEKAGPYTVQDVPHPLNLYGASKLRGERHVFESAARSYVIRTSWLYGQGGRNFVETMLRLGAEQGEVRIVSDQRGAPTLADDLAAAALDLVQSGRFGLYHITNQGLTTWFDFARAIFTSAGMNVSVIPTRSADLRRPAKRPLNSALDLTSFEEAVGYVPPSWEDALIRYLQRRLVTAV